MWLASLSLWDAPHVMRPADVWTEEQRAVGLRILECALLGVGDRSRERLFRMCATLCLHRGLSDDELERLPGPAGCKIGRGRSLAGGPVQVYYSRGTPPGLLSCEPCERVGEEELRNYLMIPGGATLVDRQGRKIRDIADNRFPVWLPVDCGACGPCLARAAIEAGPA